MARELTDGRRGCLSTLPAGCSERRLCTDGCADVLRDHHSPALIRGFDRVLSLFALVVLWR
jgi:hypothetical protein